MKRCGKRGQFYLLAAIVIISILIGFSAVSNYIGKATKTTIYDLGKELDIESANVIDYGTYDASRDTSTLLEDFSEKYADYIGEDKEIVFVIATPDEISAIPYETENQGCIEDEDGARNCIFKRVKKDPEDLRNDVITNPDGKDYVNVKFGDQDYQFEKPQGTNYYFVIQQQIGEEKFVYKK